MAALHDALPNLDDIHIVVELWRLLRLLGDGHAGIMTRSVPPQWQGCLPKWFYLVTEGLFLIDASRAARSCSAHRFSRWKDTRWPA